MTGAPLPAVLLVTGIMAAGKSTVAEALARRLPRSVHLLGDVFRRMIVGGRAAQDPGADPEAARQLALRYALAADAAARYAGAGFSVIVQDVLFGADLLPFLARLAPWRPGVVVLCPAPAVAAACDRTRHKVAYGAWAPEALDRTLREDTPRIGLWLDNGGQDVAQTVDAILAHAAETRAGVPAA